MKIVLRGDRQKNWLFPTHWDYQSRPLPAKLEPGEQWTALFEQQLIAAEFAHLFGPKPNYPVWVVIADAADREYRVKFKLVLR